VGAVTPTAIFLSVLLAGLVRAIYARITGKEMFPANPKGPLYKWLGKTTHEKRQELLAKRLRDQEEERLSSRLDRRPSQRFLVSKPPK
jgi:hypothetical protein